MSQRVNRRIAVAGGGTAGHVMAGLAFLNAYRERGAECVFLGSAHGIESRLLAPRGERLTVLAGSPFARQPVSGKIRALGNAARGTMEARVLLRRERVDLVIGVGGYASVGPILAARSLGIPVVIHEANASPGHANRWLGRFAARVCGGFPETGGAFGRTRVTWTGNPVNAEIRARRAAPGDRVRFLVAGGSEGSPFLNREAPKLLAGLRGMGIDLRVRHLAGERDVEAVRAAYTREKIAACVSSFVDGMAEVYDETDVAVTCAGAITLAEIAAAGLPSLLVPLDGAAEQHQHLNARAYAAHTGAYCITEQEWDASREAAWLARVARDRAAWSDLSARAKSWSAPDAARELVRVCEEVLGGR
jgi:UDP-N-acetylglucosamine--N-acetylmuramyl-(pentapeptide) pyrophosphoryl-undecaprenol N-acetylglucosamine transferase